MHRFADPLVKIAVQAWFVGVCLLMPIHAMGQDVAQVAASQPSAEDPGQTVPAAQQNRPAGASSSPPTAKKKKSIYRSWREMADREEAGEPTGSVRWRRPRDASRTKSDMTCGGKPRPRGA